MMHIIKSLSASGCLHLPTMSEMRDQAHHWGVRIKLGRYRFLIQHTLAALAGSSHKDR